MKPAPQKRWVPLPDEIRTHDIHVGNVMGVHCNPLLSRNLIFRGS
jgi:hypothetical protein